MPDFERAKRAYIAGQDAAFRELLSRWVSDESISDAEFSAKVGQLEWDMAMDRIKWMNEKSPEAGVDASRTDDVE